VAEEEDGKQRNQVFFKKKKTEEPSWGGGRTEEEHVNRVTRWGFRDLSTNGYVSSSFVLFFSLFIIQDILLIP